MRSSTTNEIVDISQLFLSMFINLTFLNVRTHNYNSALHEKLVWKP